MVKIIGIVGSPKKDGNTSYLVETALKSAKISRCRYGYYKLRVSKY